MHNKNYSANLLDFMSSSEPISEVKKHLEQAHLEAKASAMPKTAAPTLTLSKEESKKEAKTGSIKEKANSQLENKLEEKKVVRVKKQKPTTLLKIGNVAKLLDLNTSVLRFWEDEFDELSPLRTQTGQRLYSAQDIAIAKRLKKLLHENGLTLEGAKKLLKKSTLPKGAVYHAPKSGKVKALSLKDSNETNMPIQNSQILPSLDNVEETNKRENEKRHSFLKAIELELLEIKKKLL